MRPLLTDLSVTVAGIEEHVADMGMDPDIAHDGGEIRALLESFGYRIQNIPDGDDTKPPESAFLAADASSGTLELRHKALWAVHAVSVYAQYDGEDHPDSMAGHGTLPYKGLRYDNRLQMGQFTPYADIDSRGAQKRIIGECGLLADSYAALAEEGLDPGHILYDGSLASTKKAIKRADKTYPETAEAKETLDGVLALPDPIGLVEDSHATDISASMGLNITNSHLFEMSLSPGEYVLVEDEGIKVCYVCLPSKGLAYLPSGESCPLVARWEFAGPDPEASLALLFGIWGAEDDLLHPQTYPLRMADYLTRRIRVHGVLKACQEHHGLAPKYRDLRQG